MTELLDFANEPSPPHLQLVRMALAHHRFVWIHPFGTGNGRVARLFSYAMIRAQGFAPEVQYPTINPTTVFGADRQRYYDRLSAADSLEDEALIEWADFVLEGLLHDLAALQQLAHGGALRDLVISAIDRTRRSGELSAAETDALRAVAGGTPFKSADLIHALGRDASARSRAINSFLERRLISRVTEGGRIYRIRLSPNTLTPFVFAELDERGMLPSIARDQPR